MSTDFTKVDPEKLESTRYVIHTLNSALRSFMTSNSFEEALLKAVNLVDDADTVGAAMVSLLERFGDIQAFHRSG